MKMPNPKFEKDSVMRFRNYSHTLRAPYTVYADIESFIVPVQTCITTPASERTLSDVPCADRYIMSTDYETHSVSSTQVGDVHGSNVTVAQHVPCVYSYVIIDEDGEIFKGQCVYRTQVEGENIIERMLTELLEVGKPLKETMMEVLP